MKNKFVIALVLAAVTSSMSLMSADQELIKQAELDVLFPEMAEIFGSTQPYGTLLPGTTNEQELAYPYRRDASANILSSSIRPIVLVTRDIPMTRLAASPVQLPTSHAIAHAEIESRRQAALQKLNTEFRQDLAIVEAQRAAVINYATQSNEYTAAMNDHFDRAADLAEAHYNARKAAIHAQYLQEIRDLERAAA